jgi:ParB-like chromosome segregation protein Spo0J
MKLKLTYLKTADLLPYAGNSRTHSDEQVNQIAASIKEFGFAAPICVAEGTILAGHGRVMAARKLGLAEVPTVDLSHLTPAQRRQYVVTDNKVALNAGWDEEMLAAEIALMKEEGSGLDVLGFTAEELGEFEVEAAELPSLPEGDKAPFQQKTYTLHDEQAEEVDAACAKAKQMGYGKSAVNENSNGNALAFVCQSFNRSNP